MALEIEVDRELCMGSGNCSFGAPGVFDVDDGIAVVLDPTATPEDKIVLAGQGLPRPGDLDHPRRREAGVRKQV